MFIPIRLPDANDYINECRKHWSKGAAMKKDIEKDIMLFLRGRYEGKIFVQFTWHEPNRKRDKDNIAFAKKFVLDAMQKRGIIDNDKNVAGFLDLFVYDSGKEGVDVKVEVVD